MIFFFQTVNMSLCGIYDLGSLMCLCVINISVFDDSVVIVNFIIVILMIAIIIIVVIIIVILIIAIIIIYPFNRFMRRGLK